MCLGKAPQMIVSWDGFFVTVQHVFTCKNDSASLLGYKESATVDVQAPSTSQPP